MTPEDLPRLEFLGKLHKDQGTANPLNLVEFDRDFLASFTASDRPSLWFTPRRRIFVDILWKRLGDDIGMRGSVIIWPAESIGESSHAANCAAAGGTTAVPDKTFRQNEQNPKTEFNRRKRR